jgi:hypothetical protein
MSTTMMLLASPLPFTSPLSKICHFCLVPPFLSFRSHRVPYLVILKSFEICWQDQPSFAPPASDCIFTDTRSLRHSGKIIPSFLFPNLHSTSCLFRIVVGFFYIVCILLHIIFSFFLPSFYCSFFLHRSAYFLFIYLTICIFDISRMVTDSLPESKLL